jgi:hypothetical protein
MRTGAWFPDFLEDNNVNLSMLQIFNKNQLDEYLEEINSTNINTSIFMDHCFVNFLKYFKASEDIINYAKDIILDILALKDMNKLCIALGIIVNISFVDENGHCHTPKKYGSKGLKGSVEFQMTEFNKDNSINEPAQIELTEFNNKNKQFTLILMFVHYMPNIIIDKSINTFTKNQ